MPLIPRLSNMQSRLRIVNMLVASASFLVRAAARDTSTLYKHEILPRAACSRDWVPVGGREDYTRPADGPQILSSVYVGVTNIQVTDTRTTGWSTTINGSLSFVDILSLGISFSESFSESESDSEIFTYPLNKGKSGYVVWTSAMRCSEGEFPSPSSLF